MLGGLITIAGGILAASALIIARKPNAKELINKLTPYQGWIGVVMFGWGVWEIINSVRFLEVLKVAPLIWTFVLASGIADLVVGFLLGFGLIMKYTLGNSPTAQLRADNVRVKLATYQGTFGLVAIALGVLYILLPYIL